MKLIVSCFKKVTFWIKLLVSALVLLMVGCVTPQSYDYSALEASAPRSILVIPPLNQSFEVQASYIFLSTISRPLAEKGYYVFPVSVIDNFMKANGLPTPEEMNQVPLEKLDEIIGADAVLYTTIDDWGRQYQLVSSVVTVSANMRLVDGKSGQLLWSARAFAQESSNSGGGDILGAMIGAVVDQVVGGLADTTPALSRQANYSAINNAHQGLLNGPYRPIEEK